ncbi:RagB/SusD family nutrient uptake outer membrane protein [Weeksellaceae bacterium A-14]
MKNVITIIIFAAFISSVSSCHDFLEEKADDQLSIPETVADQQALLDNYMVMNTEFTSAAIVCTDDYYLTDAQFNAIPFEENKRLYTWMPDHVAKASSLGNEWQSCYRAIYICNMVLYNIDHLKLKGTDADDVRGQALALRAARYLDAAQVWCLAYDPEKANNTLGLPIRLDPDMAIPSTRSTLKETYAQIISDLQAAIPLLPLKQVSRMRMARDAAYGFLARAYLYMGDYQNALLNAKQALAITGTLMDYSTLDLSATYSIPNFNQEILFWCVPFYEPTIMEARIDRNVYNTYDNNDLRKNVFFANNTDDEIIFKGFYNRNNGPNPGVAVDELYLMISECEARLGNMQEAMDNLNKLLETRWKPGTFTPYVTTSQQEALTIIRKEREKEMPLRGIQWADIKRYNRDGANITMHRTVNGQSYELPPNDLRYAVAIPEEIIKIAGIPQNPR